LIVIRESLIVKMLRGIAAIVMAMLNTEVTSLQQVCRDYGHVLLQRKGASFQASHSSRC
jgi:hypothetical protein